jgi:hypothetical protein
VFALAAVAGAVLACRLVALSAPSIRRPPAASPPRPRAAPVKAPAVSEAAHAKPDGTP